MDHSQQILAALASIFVLGVGAQWLAWKIKVPAILLLLAVGSFSGSVTKWIEPEKIFGDLLLPMVSLSVGLILFEGGLSLRFQELHKTWRSLLGLFTVGVLITWMGATLAGIYILGLKSSVALVLGAVLTVTGPTVIGPLLRDIRPMGNVGVVAKWEGIVIDPIGATLALLVYEAIDSVSNAQYSSALQDAVSGLVIVLAVGVGIGLFAAWLLTFMMKKFLIPDYLQNPMSLMFVVASFASADLLHHEAGLLAVTVMGIALANQKSVEIEKMVEFKESLTVLLIMLLFILLSARVPLESLATLGWRGPIFAMVLILVVRPVSVWVSTIGSKLSKQERLFLCWLAPRGIVAAAVSSVFAIRLGESGSAIAPATFIVIFMTVATYGLTSGWLARKLGLSSLDAQGLLIAGASPFVISLASLLKKEGFTVVLVDTRYSSIRKAKDAGINAIFANILSNHVLEEIDFGGIGRFLSCTSNDEINTLSAARFRGIFGRERVYQLVRTEKNMQRMGNDFEQRLTGRTLFSNEISFSKLETMMSLGASVKLTRLTDTFDYTAFLTHYGTRAWPLFIVDGKKLLPIVANEKINPKSGQAMISLVIRDPNDLSADSSITSKR